MNDFRDLKATAEACQQHQPLRFMRSHGALFIRNDNGIVFDVHQNRSFPEFMAQNKDYADLVLAANPATILALIAENEALAGVLRRFVNGEYEQDENQAERHMYFTEAQSLLALVGGELKGHTIVPDSAIKAIHAERDQLKAEVAGLKTGYEAYERVNAELKAEVEKLRKERDARHPFKPFHEPSIGFTGCVICGVYTDHGGLPCPRTRATADAAMGQGEQS